jgi:hypothetical protein
MSIFQDVYTILNVTAVTNLVDDISPYVRARGTDFPAVIIEVPTQQFDRLSTGVYRTVSDVEVSVMARSVLEAEAVADAVLTVVSTEDCIALESMSREYEEGYDDDSVGLFTVTINFTSFGA